MVSNITSSQNKKLQQLDAHVVYDADKGNSLTTNMGVTVSNDTDSLKATTNGNGPTLLEDFHFREKINHFDHESIPERVVHARGTAAHGVFKLHTAIPQYSYAEVLNNTSIETPVFVRFSTVLGSRGSADNVRDVRGFAVKFYTQQGNWDIVGNNIPVFFIQDALKFPDIIHSGKPEPHTDLPQAATAHDNFWDFVSYSTETAHMVCWAMSDRAIPVSLRHMAGFGVNTFTLINSKGERTLTKFHWKPRLGIHSRVWDECLKINGADPDVHRRDLYEQIELGNYPTWDFGIQTMTEAEGEKQSFDPLDATKIWPEELFPVQWIGEMTLNANPKNHHAEVEQVAYCTSNIIPGIDFSDDPLLQGRNFSYLDTQITRLGGVNFHEIPINRPVTGCPFFNNQRAGIQRHTINASPVNYYPNRFAAPSPAEAKRNKTSGFESYPEKIAGIKARLKAPRFADHYTQAQLFYNSMSPVEKLHMANAFKFELGKVDDEGVKQRVVDNIILHIDYELAKDVATFIGATVPDTPPYPNNGHSSKFLSQVTSVYSVANPTIATRKVGILVADGFDAASTTAIRAALKTQGGSSVLIAPQKGKVTSSTGESQTPDFTYHTSRSILFDALIIADGSKSAEILKSMGIVGQFLNEAYSHNKVIGGVGSGVGVIQAFATGWTGVTYATDSGTVNSRGVITTGDYEHGLVKKAAAAVGVNTGSFDTEFVNTLKYHRVWDRDVSRVPS